MNLISFKRHRLPAAVIAQAVRGYFRFTLSIRHVEALMAERRVEGSRAAIRCWVVRSGALIAGNLRRAGRVRENSRAEDSQLPIRRRERQQQRFKTPGRVPPRGVTPAM